MKKKVGAVLLVISIIGTIGFVKKMSEGGSQDQSSGNAYESGRKAGKYSAPFVIVAVGIFGLRLLLSSEMTRPPRRPRRGGHRCYPVRPPGICRRCAADKTLLPAIRPC